MSFVKAGQSGLWNKANLWSRALFQSSSISFPGASYLLFCLYFYFELLLVRRVGYVLFMFLLLSTVYICVYFAVLDELRLTFFFLIIFFYASEALSTHFFLPCLYSPESSVLGEVSGMHNHLS